MAQLHPTPEDREQNVKQPSVGLMAVCCLPMIAIAVILIVAGGTGAGFMIPAITSGAMIGVMMYISLRDKPDLSWLRTPSQRA
jgi:sugar phosphate permease